MYIADIARYALKTGIEDITGFFSPSFLPICWSKSKQVFYG
jgi:hypothetical protein